MALQGWVHNSVYTRNIVVDYGNLAENPALHPVSPVKRFRIIDFGRTLPEEEDEDSVSWNYSHTWQACAVPSAYYEKRISYHRASILAEEDTTFDIRLPVAYPRFELCENVHGIYSYSLIIFQIVLYIPSSTSILLKLRCMSRTRTRLLTMTNNHLLTLAPSQRRR